MNKNKILALMSFCVALLLLPVFGGARDHLVHWWRFDDANKDGVLQPSEVYDVMTLGAETPLRGTEILQCTDTSAYPAAKPIYFTNTFQSVTMRREIGGGIVMTNPKESDDSRKVNIQSITLPQAAAMTGEEGTIAARFVWFGHRTPRTSDSKWVQPTVIYNNGWTSGGKNGWALAMSYYQPNASDGQMNALPGFIFGNSKPYFYTSTTVTDGTTSDYNSGMPAFKGNVPVTYDYAVSFRRSADGNVTVTTYMRRYPDKSTYPCPITATKTFPSPDTDLTTVDEVSIGYKGSADFTDYTDGDNSFAGILHDVRVYDKALEAADMEGLFCDSFDQVVGSANGSSDEFGSADAATPYDATESWAKMPALLDESNPSVQLKFSLPYYGYQLGRILHIAAKNQPGTSGGYINVLFNGRQIGSKCVRPDGGKLRFWLSPDLMKTIVKDETTGLYPFTLTLERGSSGQSAIAIDAVSVDGAWQIGTPTGSYEIFGGQGNYNFYYHAGQNDPEKMAVSLGGGGLLDKMYLRFEVSDWAAENLAHNLYIRTWGTCCDSLTLKLNGEDWMVIPKDAPADGTNIVVSAGTFRGGVNQLRISRSTSSNWINWRCWRLSTVGDLIDNYDKGMKIIVH